MEEELRTESEALYNTLHADVRSFAIKKKPLLLNAILEELGWPATAREPLIRFLTNGFPALGEFPATGVFPLRNHSATATIEEVLKASKWARPKLINEKPRAEDPVERTALWNVTIEERDRGECDGPFTAGDLDKLFEDGWLGIHRFAVYQKGKAKPRPCDHYSEFGHNATSSTTETVDTEGPDVNIAIAKCWVSAAASAKEGAFVIPTESGEPIRGQLHHTLTKAEVEELTARLIDLERAYKQLALDPEHARLCIFALRDEDGQWRFFISRVLGFGARNAVFGFNLAARALRFILAMGLWIPASHFFDDFSHVQPSSFAEGNSLAVERLFNLLGWSFKAGPEDLLPTRAVFHPLGVQISFEQPGYASIANTEKRCTKICDQVDEQVAADQIDEPAIVSLVGVCQFAEAQTSGRSGSVLLKAVRNALRDSPQSEDMRSALRHLKEHTLAAVPRVVRLSENLRPIIILTDAAAEPDKVTLGGCLFDFQTNTREYFGCELRGAILQRWRDEGKEQVICQAELIAVPIAIWCWRKHLCQRNALVFVDNEPAKDALIRGSSASPASCDMVRQTRLLCASLALGAWYARVPSPSNLADGPSRSVTEEVKKLGAKMIRPSLPPCFTDASLW